MDGSAWIGLSILLAVILLLGYVRKASMASSKKLSRLFDRIAKEKKLNITERVSWDAGILGIDVDKHAIVFVQENKHVLEHSMFYLKSIESCKVLHERNPNSTRIILEFAFGDSNVPPFTICFYNSSIDIMASLSELKEKAEQIKDVVEKLMQNKLK